MPSKTKKLKILKFYKKKKTDYRKKLFEQVYVNELSEHIQVEFLWERWNFKQNWIYLCVYSTKVISARSPIQETNISSKQQDAAFDFS